MVLKSFSKHYACLLKKNTKFNKFISFFSKINLQNQSIKRSILRIYKQSISVWWKLGNTNSLLINKAHILPDVE